MGSDRLRVGDDPHGATHAIGNSECKSCWTDFPRPCRGNKGLIHATYRSGEGDDAWLALRCDTCFENDYFDCPLQTSQEERMLVNPKGYVHWHVKDDVHCTGCESGYPIRCVSGVGLIHAEAVWDNREQCVRLIFRCDTCKRWLKDDQTC